MTPPRIGALLALLLSIGVPALGDPSVVESASAAEATPARLESGRVVGEADGRSFAIGPIEPGHRQGADALRIRLQQRGCDAILRLVDADGIEIRADQPLGFHEPELLLVPDGVYRLEVKMRSPGAYRLSWQPASMAEARSAGDRAWTRASDLFARDRPEDRQEAEQAFLAAAEAWDGSAALDRDRARALFVAGHVAADRGESERGLELSKQALAVRIAVEDPHGQAEAHHQIGNIHRRQGELGAARAAFETSFELSTSAHDPRGQARALLNLGFVDQRSDLGTAARERYESALELAWTLGDPALEAKLLNNLAGLDFESGELANAVGRFEALERLGRHSGDARSRARTLINLAAARRALGRYQAALDAYEAASELLAEAGDQRLLASALNNLGFTYLRLGDPARAENYLLRALEVRRAVADPRGEGVTTNNLGLAALARGDLESAEQLFRRALASRRQVEDIRGEATTLHHLGRLERQRGQPELARGYLEAALEARRRQGDEGRIGATLGELSAVYLSQGRFDRALALADEAVALHRRFGDRDGEVAALGARSEAWAAKGERASALADAEEAIALVESLRFELRDPDARATLLGVERQVYEQAVDLWVGPSPAGASEISAAREAAPEAFAVAERARGRSFVEVMSQLGASATTEPSRSRLEALAGLQYRVERLRRRGREPSAELLERIGRQEKDLADQASASAIPSIGLEAFRGSLDEDTSALVFSIGEKRSFVWIVDRDGARLRILPGRQALAAEVERVYDDFSTLDPRGLHAERERARQLSRRIFGAEGVPAGARRLLIVPEGSLRYLPFAALPLPDGEVGSELRVVDRHEVVYLPSASALAALERFGVRPAAPELLAVLADPLYAPAEASSGFDASEASKSKQNNGGEAAGGSIVTAPELATESPRIWPRLAASRVEAERLSTLTGGQAHLRLGADAARAWVVGGGLRPYRYVHFATHGLVDGRFPERSSLVLSLFDAQGRPVDGHLRSSDIYQLELAADLVVLGGCETGLGQDVRGEGILGLTRGFFFAGAARVLSSSWRIDDASTAELMDRFYRHLLPAGGEAGEGTGGAAAETVATSPSAALRLAQSELRKDRRFGDPYYWAGFLLHGDWRVR